MNDPQASQKDVQSVDAIIQALYECVSFSPGAQPDYDRLKSLFHPDGRLMPPKGEKDENILVLDVETFINKSRVYVITSGLEYKGFHEKEVHRIQESFGKIVHVFSTYESRDQASDPQPIQRGINSIQLVNDAGRWWVVSVMWDVERPSNQIPSHYIGS